MFELYSMNQTINLTHLVFLFSSILGQATYAQHVSSYSLEVEFFPDEAEMYGFPVSNEAFMKGSAEVSFSEIESDTINFFLHGELKIDSIFTGNKQINYNSKKIFDRRDYSRVTNKTIIQATDLSSHEVLKIYYSGFINPSRARSLSDYMRINKNEGVFLRSYGYSLWFPVFLNPGEEDYPFRIKKIEVKLPENYKCVAVGELINETISNGIYTADWNPGMINLINVQITAREYKVLGRDNLYVYYVAEIEQAEKIIDYAKTLKTFFYSNLRKVQDTSSLYIIELPKFGNISSHNVIGISTDVYKNFDNNLSSKTTIAHELVHPYVNIPISKNNSLAALVIEGFPSFFHLYGLHKTMNNSEFDIKKYMRIVEKNYLNKKNTGKDRRGNQLPPEKPILEISYEDIGKYKDQFILPDRVRLFLYHLWTEMGEPSYDQFLKELFQFDSITYKKLENLVVKYIPGYEANLNIWLNTVDYPQSLQLNKD